MSYKIIDKEHRYVGTWMQQYGSVYRDGTTCIGLERDGELVAATCYDYFNNASIMAGIVIQGPITRQWLHYIFAYPFVQLKVNVIIGLIAGNNWKSARLSEHLGFAKIAEIPHAHSNGYLDIYTMHRDNCKFIRGKYEQAITATCT